MPWTGPAAAAAAQPAPDTLVIAYIAGQESSAWLGVQQGVDELNLLGRFTGHKYRVERLGIDDMGRVADLDAVAVIAAADSGLLERVQARIGDRAILNVTAQDDRLRQLCRENLLHVIPSLAMQRDAVAQWQRKNPGADVRAVAWHPAFQKYAGRDLNNRFRKTHGTPMDSAAWAGWAAAKAVGEAVLRSGTTQPREVLAYMRSELAFDAQKGVAVSFRPTTGQLRQPLILVQQDKIVGEAPVAGVTDVEDLDSLGALSCAGSG